MDAKTKMRLEKALAVAEKCPYHECLPKMVGRDIAPPEVPEEQWDRMTMLAKDTFMDKTYPDVLLFPGQGYTCFCEECAKKTPTPGKHNKFGCGFSSQYAWRAALGNWNKACLRFVKSSIMKTLKDPDAHDAES